MWISEIAELTLYAKWTANTTAIALDKNGGGADGSVAAAYDAALPAFTALTRTGYALAGYFTEATDGAMVIDAGGTLASSVSTYTSASSQWIYTGATLTLHAQWAANNKPSIASLTLKSSDGDTLKRWKRENITDTILYELPCHRSSAAVEVSCELPPGARGSYTVTAALLAGGAKYAAQGETDSSALHFQASVGSLALTVISVALENTASGDSGRYTIVLSKKLGLFDAINERLSGRLRVVSNNPATNRTGLKFSACAWWRKRDTETSWQLVEESRLYYTAGPSLSDRFSEKDSMRLELTLLNGATLETCPDANTAAASESSGGSGSGGSAGKSNRVTTYPNPVASGGFIKLRKSDFADGEEEEEEERYVKYSLFSSQGSPALTGDASPLYEGQGIAMPYPPGIYYLLLEGKNGKRWVAKVAVER
jgi:hypothetical protein